MAELKHANRTTAELNKVRVFDRVHEDIAALELHRLLEPILEHGFPLSRRKVSL
jgi:hypothetical protein